MRAGCAAALLVASIALAAAPVRALDRFEIQVYREDLAGPGEIGLEVHLNYTASGTRTPAYAGNVPPYHVGRMTFEPAIGITDWLELGAYLQLMAAPGGDARFAGAKARAKLVVPERAGLPLFLGLNVELARVPLAVEPERWANELRPIVGWRSDRWLVSLNPIVGYALTGPDRFRPELEPCAKVAWDTRLGFAAGAEYYASLGFANDLLPARAQEHLLLAVVDLVDAAYGFRGPPAGAAARAARWELNVGVGGALTDAPGPHVLAKAIVGRSF